MSDRTLPWVFTVDVDADHFDDSIAGRRAVPQFRGLSEGVPWMLDVLRSYRDARGRPPRFTWFVRVDAQLEALLGSATHLLTTYQTLWRDRLSQGDELAWHPHLCRCRDGRWVQEAEGPMLRRALLQSYQAMTGWGVRPRTARIGEAYMHPVVFQVFEELGIEVDSTAMPGRRRRDATRLIDWGPTPAWPYYPSRDDYRVPGRPAFSTLEVPMSMTMVRAAYDRGPILRYVDLSFRHDALRGGLRAMLTSARVLVTLVHPSGLVPLDQHGLISFAPEDFRRNMDLVVAEAARAGRELQFALPGECSAWSRADETR
jgi:hypothetical protein